MEATLDSVAGALIERLKKAQADLEDLRAQLKANPRANFDGMKVRFNQFLEEIARMFDKLNELKDKMEEGTEDRWGELQIELEKAYDYVKKSLRV